ncbi:MAG: tetratricopeptide repeat protein [Candidatus Aureabacteria bacterium]|nr:tetratricopeptide repeat protein [Candidatus Auribacterota bacterium]
MKQSRCRIYRSYILIALLICVPLFYAEPGLFGIALPDAFNFPKQYLATAGALALFLIFAFDLISRGRLHISWNRSMSALSLFILWSCISLLWAPGPHLGVREIGRWCIVWIIFLSAMNDLTAEGRASAALRTAWIVALVVSSVALMQFFGVDFSSYRGGRFRIYSTLGNPNYVASYLAVVIPSAYLSWLSSRPRRSMSALSLIVSLSGTAALLASGSRGGIASLLLGTIIAVAILKPPIVRRRLLLLVLAASALFVFVYLPSPLNRYSAQSVEKFAEIGAPRYGTAWRMLVWNIGWRIGLEHPLRGSGSGSFTLLYLSRMAEFLKEPGHVRYLLFAESGIDFAHQEYLQIWIELGLIGIIFFAWFLLSLLATAFRKSRGEDLPDWMIASLSACCAAFLIEGMVSFPFHLWASAVTFFVFGGILAARHRVEKVILIENTFSRIMAAILATGIALIVSYSSLCSIISEVHSEWGFNAYSRGERDLAIKEFTLSTLWQPRNGQARFFRGLCLSEEGRYGEAIQELRTALETYSRQEVYLEIGKAYEKAGQVQEAAFFMETARLMKPLNQDALIEKGNQLFRAGDMNGAADCYRGVLYLAPDSFTAARNLAVSLQAMGRNEEALRFYNRAVELGAADVDLYVNMGSIYAQKGDKERARSLWRKALSINPAERSALENLKRLDLRDGEPAKGRNGEPVKERNGEPATR